jgi:hypothetical protein
VSYTTVISCVASGRVRRKTFASRRRALAFVRHYAPANRARVGWRIELAWGKSR